jgi:enterochelin esterase-like enzyme
VHIEVHRIAWKGRADGVAVKSFMPRFPGHLPMQLSNGQWSVDLHLPSDARIEYRFEIRRGSRHESTLDPENPEIATNPFGENSVLRSSEYPASPPLTPSVEWKRRAFRVPSAAFGGRRDHHLLSPADVRDRDPLPLLLLHDGSDYANHAVVGGLLGAAVRAGHLPAMRVALLEPRHRNVEYAADPRHATHVVDEVIPRLHAMVGLTTQRVVAGASLGAVASWHAAWSRPDAFSGVVLQSGTFAFSGGAELPAAIANPIRSFLHNALADNRLGAVRLGQTCGRYESLIDWNRTVAERLGPSVAAHRYEERWTGHDWGAWSDTLLGALQTAFDS